jgi:hypothetical protein
LTSHNTDGSFGIELPQLRDTFRRKMHTLLGTDPVDEKRREKFLEILAGLMQPDVHRADIIIGRGL